MEILFLANLFFLAAGAAIVISIYRWFKWAFTFNRKNPSIKKEGEETKKPVIKKIDTKAYDKYIDELNNYNH